jgi:DNA invertase Pin-like site-specific DNA recombinase
MKNVILYVRVSTDEQAKLGYSLGHQELVLTKFSEIKEFKVVGIYREDFSAKNFERPEYKKLFKYCKTHRKEIDYVLVTKWDRFSRNQTDALQELKSFGELGIEVNAAEQWIDFSIPHNKMMLSIYLTIPEIDNDVRGINTKMGLRRSWKSGRWTGVAPAGYKNGRDQSNKPVLVIDQEKAELVKETFEQFATGLYDKEELRRIMWSKGLKLSKSTFPRTLQNHVYAGKVCIPQYKDEDEEVIQGVHEPIISEELFNKVQRLITGNRKHKKQYEKLDEETPLRALLTCRKCGGKLTSSASKGRNGYYNYYHCKSKCGERIPAAKAHKALLKYFDDVAVKPEVANLYLKVMETIFKANETQADNDIKRTKESLSQAESKLASLEEKYVLNEIEKDSYNFMKPKFKAEIKKLQNKLDEMSEQETNHSKYLNFGVNLIQNLSFYYENASLKNKQKLVGSIFPENLIIENNECRTARENEVILALKGFERDFKKEKPDGQPGFPTEYPGRELNPYSHYWPQDFIPIAIGTCVSTTPMAIGHHLRSEFV